MTADLLALLESDPAAGILAVAELREQRAEVATPGPWYFGKPMDSLVASLTGKAREPEDAEVARHYGGQPIAESMYACDLVHIAAEANPAHALAAVRRWRGVVERHRFGWDVPAGSVDEREAQCANRCGKWPCPDLQEVADEARAYLGAPS